MIFRVLDVETTGLELEDEVVELATVDLPFDGSPGRLCRHWAGLCKPSIPIPPEVSAVHHITDDMVADKMPWAELAQGLLHPDTATYFVAHKADFDGMFVTEALRAGKPLLCTYKAALRIWPEAPGFSNQILRYWLKLKIDDGVTEPAHRALPDANVTAHLLIEILKKASITDLIAWSGQPAVLPRVSFGKHAGAQWSEVPDSYLDWILKPDIDLDSDVKWNARFELDRRQAANRHAYVDACCEAVHLAVTVEDLMSWFTHESDHRRRYGIAKEDPDYARIVAACATRKAQIVGAAA